MAGSHEVRGSIPLGSTIEFMTPVAPSGGRFSLRVYRTAPDAGIVNGNANQYSLRKATPMNNPTGSSMPPGATPPAPPLPVGAAPVAQRSTAVVVLGTIVAIQAVVILGLLLALGSMAFFGPFGMMDIGFDDENYLLADDVGYEVRALLERGDLEGYLEMYDEDDPKVDRAKVRKDFETAAEGAGRRDSSFEVYPGMWQEFRDTESDDRLMRLDLEMTDWNTGRSVSRLRVWVRLDQPSGEIVLTGNLDRQLESVGMPW